MLWFFVKWGLVLFAVLFLAHKFMPRVLRDWVASKWSGLWSRLLKK